MIVFALGACGSDGPAANLASSSADAATDEGAAPAPTEAPVDPAAPVEPEAPAEPEAPVEPEAPAPTTPIAEPIAPTPTTPESETSDGGNDWLLPVLVIGGLLLIAVAIGGALSRSKQPKQPAPAAQPTPQQRHAEPSAQASLLSTTQWIADQLTLELLAAPPAAALQRWGLERSRLDNVAIGAQQQYLDAQDPNWQPLSQTMSTLAAAIDTSLTLRAQDPPNAQLISDSIDVVSGHRARLHQLVAVLLPTTAT